MIPEAPRDAVLRIVEESLGTKVEHLGSPSLPTRSISEDSDLTVKHIQNRLPESSPAPPMEKRYFGSVSGMISQLPAASLRQSNQSIPPNKAGFEDLRSVTVTFLSSAEERGDTRATEKERSNEDYFADSKALDAEALSPGEPPEANETLYGYTRSLTPLNLPLARSTSGYGRISDCRRRQAVRARFKVDLAEQLINRSCLMKTMSEAEKQYVPSRMIAILKILLKHGWDVNAPFEMSGRTVFHQPVTFGTG